MRKIVSIVLLVVCMKTFSMDQHETYNATGRLSSDSQQNIYPVSVILPERDPAGQSSESTEQEDTSNFSCLCHDIEDLHLNERQRIVVYRDSWRLKAYRFFAIFTVIYGVYSFAMDVEYDEYSSLLSILGLAMLVFDCGMEGLKPLRHPQLSLC